MLEAALDLVEDLGVEKLTQLDPAQQLPEQRGVDTQRGGTLLGQRRVSLVDEGAHVVEEQGLRER